MRFPEKLRLCCLGSEPATWLRETTVPSGPPWEPRGLGRGPLCVCALCERVCTHTPAPKMQRRRKAKGIFKAPVCTSLFEAPPAAGRMPGTSRIGQVPWRLASRAVFQEHSSAGGCRANRSARQPARHWGAGRPVRDCCSVLPGAVPPSPARPKGSAQTAPCPPPQTQRRDVLLTGGRGTTTSSSALTVTSTHPDSRTPVLIARQPPTTPTVLGPG